MKMPHNQKPPMSWADFFQEEKEKAEGQNARHAETSAQEKEKYEQM